ncbi:TPM domain-containing protein [Allocoleopsis sp.]|uniref:TPM domain-containing protein n=1 Tax=Allocoleopsis sp. TaxID=3088169 RepID=UPI002FD1CADC
MTAERFQLKRFLKASPFTLAIVLFPCVGLAVEVKDVPNPRQINGTWVTDMAGMLDEPTEAQLNSMISQLERKNGTEIAVVTVPETAPAASPKEFTTKLFNYWGIGKKGKDNGVLLLISKGDRRVEIETGYGMEAILPDAKVGNIINTQITPRFKQGDFKGGTLAGTKALVVAIEKPQSSSVSQKPTPTAIASGTAQTLLPTQSSALEQEPTEDAKVPWGLLGGGGALVLAIGTAAFMNRRVLIEPEGRSRFKGGRRVCICANCKKRMEKVDESIIQFTLSKPEQVAQQLGSVRFEGWKCPECSQQLTESGFHRVAYVPRFSRFCECPTCEELTATRTTQILQHPTEYSTGRRLIIDQCQCCDYYQEREETIPCLPPPPPPSSSSSGGGSSGGGSSGGGSFGGGSSGGGGAGGSW